MMPVSDPAPVWAEALRGMSNPRASSRTSGRNSRGRFMVPPGFVRFALPLRSRGHESRGTRTDEAHQAVELEPDIRTFGSKSVRPTARGGSNRQDVPDS